MTESTVLTPGSAEAGIPSPTVTSPVDRRVVILLAAQACFARSGFHGASMQEICAEAQMSPGALYRYFRSKDEIIEAIAEEERIRNMQILSNLEDGGDVCDRMIRCALVFLDDMSRPGAAALMTEVMAEALRNSEIGERFLRNEAEVRERIGSVLLEKVSAAEIAPVAPLPHALGFLSAIVEGLVVRMALDRVLTVEVVEPLLRTVADAILRPRPAGDAAPSARDGPAPSGSGGPRGPGDPSSAQSE